MARPRRKDQAAPPPVAGASAPGPSVDAPCVAAVPRPPPSAASPEHPAASTPAPPACSASDSQVLSTEVQEGTKRRGEQKKPPQLKQFRSPIAPMAVKSLGIKLMLTHLGSPSRGPLRSPSTVALKRNMVPPPELMDDVTTEIFLRLPPDEPDHLIRASLVCKRWLRLLSDPDFLCRYRAFHRVPPLLGLLHRRQVFEGDPVPRLIPTTVVPLTPCPYFRRALDCHHGRVLLHVDDNGWYLIVWDPVTGDQQRVPEPGIDWLIYTAAVFCAVSGCDHINCHGGPFRVVFVATDEYDNQVKACMYSSETGVWSKRAILDSGCEAYVQHRLDALNNGGGLGMFYTPYVEPRRGALVGNEFYFTLRWGNAIVKYDWINNCLSMINPPSSNTNDIALMEMEDNTLGFACIEGSSLYLWSRNVKSEGSAEWMQCRHIELDGVIPVSNPKDEALVVGSAEVLGVIFVTTGAGLFIFELKSGRVRKIAKPHVYFSVLPYMSFYTPDRAIQSVLANAH